MGPPRTIRHGWIQIIKNLNDYAFLIRQLVRIDILDEYKRSFIGIAWLFLVPIFSVVSWILFDNSGVLNPGDTEVPYPAFVLLSTSIWVFFIDIYYGVSKIFVGRSRMIVMTKFPREVLVAEKIIFHLIRFLIPLIINIVILLFFGVNFKWSALLFPFTLLPLLLLGISIGLIISFFRVVATDLAKIVDHGLGFLMILTPIVYTPQIEAGILSEIIQYNPMTYLVGFSREILLNGGFFEPWLWLGCSCLIFCFFLFTVRFFLIAEVKIVERLISN